jgi:hypothetical protein
MIHKHRVASAKGKMKRLVAAGHKKRANVAKFIFKSINVRHGKMTIMKCDSFLTAQATN